MSSADRERPLPIADLERSEYTDVDLGAGPVPVVRFRPIRDQQTTPTLLSGLRQDPWPPRRHVRAAGPGTFPRSERCITSILSPVQAGVKALLPPIVEGDAIQPFPHAAPANGHSGAARNGAVTAGWQL